MYGGCSSGVVHARGMYGGCSSAIVGNVLVGSFRNCTRIDIINCLIVGACVQCVCCHYWLSYSLHADTSLPTLQIW